MRGNTSRPRVVRNRLVSLFCVAVLAAATIAGAGCGARSRGQREADAQPFANPVTGPRVEVVVRRSAVSRPEGYNETTRPRLSTVPYKVTAIEPPRLQPPLERKYTEAHINAARSFPPGKGAFTNLPPEKQPPDRSLTDFDWNIKRSVLLAHSGNRYLNTWRQAFYDQKNEGEDHYSILGPPMWFDKVVSTVDFVGEDMNAVTLTSTMFLNIEPLPFQAKKWQGLREDLEKRFGPPEFDQVRPDDLQYHVSWYRAWAFPEADRDIYAWIYKEGAQTWETACVLIRKPSMKKEPFLAIYHPHAKSRRP